MRGGAAKRLARGGMSMRIDSGYEGVSARMEMTPLMDVVFLLLVFFIYAILSMSPNYGIGVSLPKAVADALPGRQAVIVLTADGVTWFEGAQVEADGLAGRVATECGGKPVLIRADEAVPIGRGLELLAELRAAGIHEVAFQTQSEREAASAR